MNIDSFGMAGSVDIDMNSPLKRKRYDEIEGVLSDSNDGATDGSSVASRMSPVPTGLLEPAQAESVDGSKRSERLARSTRSAVSARSWIFICAVS